MHKFFVQIFQLLLMESFGTRLKRLREAQKLSQEELANKIGRTGKNVRNVISNWEKDRAEPSLSDITKISEALGVSVNELVSGHPSSFQDVPAGYSIIPTDELIELQRQVIQQQKAKLAKQK